MLCFAARVVRHPAMQNPTLVVLTDRNDLDDENRASGGVVFTTIPKFMQDKGEAMPELSARQNIVAIADKSAPQPNMGSAAR